MDMAGSSTRGKPTKPIPGYRLRKTGRYQRATNRSQVPEQGCVRTSHLEIVTKLENLNRRGGPAPPGYSRSSGKPYQNEDFDAMLEKWKHEATA